MPAPSPDRRAARVLRAFAPAALVAAAALAAHGGAVSAALVAYDDDARISQNWHVTAGLTPEGVRWAFLDGRLARGHAMYFQPFTWLSLMLDRSVFGSSPWGFHLTNVLLHAGTAVLLFLAWRRATGLAAASLAAAVLFAVHPLTVEPVAWASERNTVLATFFGLAAVLAYVHHAARPSGARLAAVSALGAAAFLAKPSLVVLPALLAVLDLWPLRRLARAPDALAPGAPPAFPSRPLRALLLEKVPLLAVSAVGVAIAVVSTRELPGEPPPPEAVSASGWLVPLGLRVENAIASVPRYLAAAVWPSGFSVFHPFPVRVPASRVALGVAALAGITAVALATARRRPWLLAGWLWFLVAVGPVLGLRQFGLWPAWAERFAYVPLVGLAFGAAFGAADLARTLRAPRALAPALAAAAAVALAVASRAQTRHWRDSEALFRRAVAVEPLAAEMHHKLGQVLVEQGRWAEAEASLAEALRIAPWQTQARAWLASLLRRTGRAQEAEAQLREALRWDPDHRDTLYLLYKVLEETGRPAEARPFFLRWRAIAAAEGG